MKTIDETKTWLQRYGEIMRDIQYSEERYLTLKSKSVSISSLALDDIPRRNGTISDRTANYAIRLEAIKETITEQRKTAEDIYDEIELAIKQIQGKGSPDMKAVLRMRYLDSCKWEEVNEMLFSRSNEDFWDKEDSYRRRLVNIHKRALEQLAALLPDEITETKGEK
jgi:hypothetical protein